jgi:hypothetical protein
MSTSPLYIRNGDTTGNINSATTAGWFQLMRGVLSVGFQIILAATGAPIGLFVFEGTDDDDPTKAVGVILGATPLILVAPWSGALYQPTDGAARNVSFDFIAGSANPPPIRRWMRMRYARTSGGSAAAGSLNVAVTQKGG